MSIELTIITILLPIVVGVISYFLKRTYNQIDKLENDFRMYNQTMREIEGVLRGKIDLLKQQREADIKQFQSETQLKMEHLQEKLDSMNGNLINLANDMKLILQQLAKKGLDTDD